MRRWKFIYQLIKLCLNLPKKNKLNTNMNSYDIFWQPTLQSQFSNLCPFVNINEGVFYPSDSNWPYGYYRLTQDLNNNQFDQVDAAANNHDCIDIKPSPVPPGSPTGR